MKHQHKVVLALLLSAKKPLEEDQVELCLDRELDLQPLIQELNSYLSQAEMPMEIQKIAGGYKIVTRAEYEPYIERLFQKNSNTSLSQAALETLAIVAYTQPSTKSEVDSIRGVNTSMKTLLSKNLIEVKGRLDAPGKPLLYRTTDYFLEYFGLDSLDDLPKMKEIEELLEEKEEARSADQ
ncbi:MAG: SMC-Scp complex subunit ScpB [Candidatus Marinimicrobia bacterium]|nr:SMC-Scp complex subunit ScpB [Candidatus Neomarinimicrobiota bacterium]